MLERPHGHHGGGVAMRAWPPWVLSDRMPRGPAGFSRVLAWGLQLLPPLREAPVAGKQKQSKDWVREGR